MVQGKELTVVWHVDDLKASYYVSSTAANSITKMVNWLKSTYKNTLPRHFW